MHQDKNAEYLMTEHLEIFDNSGIVWGATDKAIENEVRGWEGKGSFFFYF
jgi:hypothetical protein